MKNRLIVFAVCTLISMNSIAAGPISMKQCNDWTREFDATLPKRIDQITVLSSAACITGITKPARVVDRYIVSIDKRELTDQQLEKLRSSQLNFWCSDYKHKNFLKMVDVTFSYFDRNGVQLFSFDTTQATCN